ncbi:MAG: HemK2/MTQ2 family protein methyltransferase [Thermoplasmatota archaeon]
MEHDESCFHFQNLTIFLHPHVYDPAEDTFLLLDALDVDSLDSVFEMGTGTGIISLACALKAKKVVCSDINPNAVELVKKNILVNNDRLESMIDVRLGSLFNVLREDEEFDLIIFNPPYLPTTEDEYVDDHGWFDKAVSGGKTGLDVTILFLEGLSDYLSNEGRAFIIVSSNSPKEIYQRILKNYDLISKTVATQSFSEETIEVRRITKKRENG